MSGLFHDIREALEEAIQHASGEPTHVHVRTVTPVEAAAAQSTPPQTRSDIDGPDAS